MKTALLPMLALIVAGCASESDSRSIDWRSLSHEQRQRELLAIAQRCKVVPDTFELRGADGVQFQPSPAAAYEDVDCALEGLKRFKNINLGFVGNEAYVGNEQ